MRKNLDSVEQIPTIETFDGVPTEDSDETVRHILKDILLLIRAVQKWGNNY